MNRIKLSLAFLCLCLTMCLSSVTAQDGTITVTGEQLNNVKNGKFIYPIDGVGDLVLIGANSVSYEYSKPSIWGKKRHRLKVDAGIGAIKCTAKDPNKRIKLRNVSVSGYAYGSVDWADVSLFDRSHYSRWNTDGFATAPYETYCNDINVWSACQMEVMGDPVSVITIKVDYTVYHVLDPLTVSENAPTRTSPYDIVESITLDRKIPAGWSTLCLPFNCQVTELGNGVKAHQFVAYDPATGLDFASVDQIQANQPYLIYSPQEIPAHSLKLSARQLSEAVPQAVTFNGMTFVGNYAGMLRMEGKYGVAGNKLVKGGFNSILRGTRAYFTNTASQGQVGVLNINIEGATTNIDVPQVEHQAVQGVYNMQGVCVRQGSSLVGLPKGVYIVNGKKCVVR